MDVCLVTVPTIAEFDDPLEIRSAAVQEAASEPQLGILSLAAVLEKQGHAPRVVDANRTFLSLVKSSRRRHRLEFAQIAARMIAGSDSDVCGFSTICSSYPLTIRIARIVKELRPECRILFGGPQASVVDLDTLLAFPFVDFILRGEAEQTFPLFLNYLEHGQQLGMVPGLTYRHSDHVCRNVDARVIEDLDDLPTPAYHLTGELHGAKKASLELGRGCPFACAFCSTNDFFRRNFRLRSPERVLSDMRSIAASYAIRHFDLVHDMFTVDRRRVLAFCRTLSESGDNFTWSCSARTDRIDTEMLDVMHRAGCRGIFYGVETGSQRMQKIIDKHLDPNVARSIIDLTERSGISSTVSLITGFPEETHEDLRQTMRFFMQSARSANSHPQLNLLAPLASTPIYQRHKGELVLQDLCSSISHQSQSQNDANLELIRAHPEIFPNFYIIPARHLDWACLIELREFALIGMTCFRWLLVAVDQGPTEMLDFFLEWREHRLRIRPTLRGFNLRRYYRANQFQRDFLSFVRSHKTHSEPSVRALLDYEVAMRQAFAADSRMRRTGWQVPPGETIRRDDKPVRHRGILLIELSQDIQCVIDALKSKFGQRLLMVDASTLLSRCPLVWTGYIRPPTGLAPCFVFAMVGERSVKSSRVCAPT